MSDDFVSGCLLRRINIPEGCLSTSIYIFRSYEDSNKNFMKINKDMQDYTQQPSSWFRKITIGEFAKIDVSRFSAAQLVDDFNINADIIRPLAGKIARIKHFDSVQVLDWAGGSRACLWLEIDGEPVQRWFHPEWLMMVDQAKEQEDLSPEQIFQKQRDDNLRAIFGS